MAQSDSSSNGSSAGRLLFYWLIVGIPLTWGVAQSVNAALPLFGGKSAYIPWVIGAPPAKPAATTAAGPSATAKPVATTTPSATPEALPTATVTPTATPSAATVTPDATPAPSAAASPFTTPQPSATAAPIDTPTVPKT